MHEQPGTCDRGRCEYRISCLVCIQCLTRMHDWMIYVTILHAHIRLSPSSTYDNSYQCDELYMRRKSFAILYILSPLGQNKDISLHAFLSSHMPTWLLTTTDDIEHADVRYVKEVAYQGLKRSKTQISTLSNRCFKWIFWVWKPNRRAGILDKCAVAQE